MPRTPVERMRLFSDLYLLCAVATIFFFLYKHPCRKLCGFFLSTSRLKKYELTFNCKLIGTCKLSPCGYSVILCNFQTPVTITAVGQ